MMRPHHQQPDREQAKPTHRDDLGPYLAALFASMAGLCAGLPDAPAPDRSAPATATATATVKPVSTSPYEPEVNTVLSNDPQPADPRSDLEAQRDQLESRIAFCRTRIVAGNDHYAGILREYEEELSRLLSGKNLTKPHFSANSDNGRSVSACPKTVSPERPISR